MLPRRAPAADRLTSTAPATAQAEVAAVYSAADAFISGSEFETLGFGAIEAMACGAPALVPRAQGFNDTVQHGVTGYLFTPDDLDDAARCLGLVTPLLTDLASAAVGEDRGAEAEAEVEAEAETDVKGSRGRFSPPSANCRAAAFRIRSLSTAKSMLPKWLCPVRAITPTTHRPSPVANHDGHHRHHRLAIAVAVAIIPQPKCCRYFVLDVFLNNGIGHRRVVLAVRLHRASPAGVW